MLTEVGPVEIEVPGDRDGTFDPVIVKKRQRRLAGVDQIAGSLTARGLTTGEVAAHFADVYGASVSKDTISRITEKVSGEMTEWATRPLDRLYPVMFIDAIRESRSVTGRSPTSRSTQVSGVTTAGERDILGIWAGDGGQGAKYWLAVLTEIKNRGVLGACASWSGRPQGPAGVDHHDLGAGPGPDVCGPPDPQHVPLRRPEGLGRDGQGPAPDLHRPERPGRRSPARRVRRTVAGQVPGRGQGLALGLGGVHRRSWTTRSRSTRSSPATNAIESAGARYRRALRARGHFPNEAAALKCLYLVTRSLDPTGRGRARWVIRWKAALNAFAITFDGLMREVVPGLVEVEVAVPRLTAALR